MIAGNASTVVSLAAESCIRIITLLCPFTPFITFSTMVCAVSDTEAASPLDTFQSKYL